MRRLAPALLLALAVAPAAHGADCTIAVTPPTGPAPLTVTAAVTGCDATSVRWSFGDGARADGATATHTYAAGDWGQSVEVATADGAVAHYDLVHVVAYQLRMASVHRAGYGDRIRLQGKLYPPLAGRVTVSGVRAKWVAKGVFRVFLRATRPGPYVARFGGASSNPVWVLLRPQLKVRIVGVPTVGSPLHVAAELVPRAAGTVRVRVDGRRTTTIDTRRPRNARVVVSTLARKGWTGPGRILRVAVASPSLARGARGESVRALERRLEELHYALRGSDGVFGSDDAEAVIAFQKVNGLARTGTVTPDLWRRLAAAHAPLARYAGTHVEVDKTRQVLFMVRDGKVTQVVHVSTGATGNTPIGLWHVYSKVPGWSWVLWYPSFFLRGFAVHGYPDVPPYPASHGCVRVPMWIAPLLYGEMPQGFPVYVYY